MLVAGVMCAADVGDECWVTGVMCAADIGDECWVTGVMCVLVMSAG